MKVPYSPLRPSYGSPSPEKVLREFRIIIIVTLVLGFSYRFHALIAPPAVEGISPGIVISQVYGGGGNTGATLRNDFIELFNRGTTAVSVTGWSVQYASSTGTSWQKTDLSGTIPAGGYYLVQQAAGTGGTVGLPTPDAVGSIAMSATAGKVALVSNNTLLTGSCPVGGAIVDFAGYGSTANCFEGTGPTPTLSNTTAAIRAGGGCTDTDDNASDFSALSPNPRNSAFAPSPCVASTNPSGTGAATPNSVPPGGTTLLTVNVTPGTNPASTGITVSSDLSSIGGSASQPLFDDGTHGDITADDNVFSFQATVGAATSTGAKNLPVSIADAQARAGSTSIALTVQSSSTSGIVISQIYGGGGNSGSLFRNDFIELYNRSDSIVSLTGWSVQYASSSGTTWQVTSLSGSIYPNQYYLIQQAQGSGGSVGLPTPDAVGTIAMSATAGKVALVGNSTALAGACPAGGAIVDFVGYGSTANCFEGTGPTPTLSNTTAAIRAGGGCTDTDNNSADFSAGSPSPRNTASPLNVCGSVTPVTLAIHAIQGSGSTSPVSGQLVTTTPSIVTGLKNNGFFIQSPDLNIDGDSNTSEGIFVFTGALPPSAAAIGNVVTVTGTVVEFVPSSDPNSPPLTEIGGSPTVSLISTGASLPAPVLLTAADTNPAGSIEQLEKFEGMRVRVNSLTVVGPTQGSINEPNATSTSNGVFYGVITGLGRPYREPGIQVPDPLPPGSPCCVPRFDGNPERLRVDSDGQIGASALEVATGAVVTNIVGVVDYAFRTYTILPDAGAPPAVVGSFGATPVPSPLPYELTIASFNLQRFFDSVDDPAIGEPVLTPTAFDNRLRKTSRAVREVMRSPDIIGVQEVENLSTLQALADRINVDTLASGGPNPGYQAYLAEGNDVGGIDVGFLVKQSRVSVLEVAQQGKNETFINPLTGLPELLNDRPPLVLRAFFRPPGDPEFHVTVIVNHLRSLLGLADVPGGARVRAKRAAQAEFLATHVQARQTADPLERVILVGDFNSFEFSDGFVDTIGAIKGDPASPDAVVLSSPDLVEPDLLNLIEVAPAEQRYSFVFDGNAQVLDHILVNDNALPQVTRFHYARNNADFPDSFRNDPSRPERISDHDMPVAYFSTDITPPTSVVTIPEPMGTGGWYTTAVTVNISAEDSGGSGVKEIEFSLSGAGVGGGKVSGSTKTFVLSAEGTTTLRYRATDFAGNVEPERTLLIRIDRTGPIVTCPSDITKEATSEAGATVFYPAPAASDNLSTPTLSFSKASGTLFPYGDTTVTVTATDEAGNSTRCTFKVTVLGPRSILRSVREEIVALRGGVTDPQEGTELDKIIMSLGDALSPGFWLDDARPAPAIGARVFGHVKDAVSRLRDLLKIKKSSPAPLLQGFVDRLMGALRQIAAVAINDGAAENGDPKDLAKAREYLAGGDENAGRGMYESAVNLYSLAWQSALKAVRKL